eukprot:1281650-Prymnesium_polylepis.1
MANGDQMTGGLGATWPTSGTGKRARMGAERASGRAWGPGGGDPIGPRRCVRCAKWALMCAV